MSFRSLIRIEEKTSSRAVPGLTYGTMVTTTEGALPVQFLTPGDRVITRAGATVLKDIEVTFLQAADMVCIWASSLGHSRPFTDFFLAPSQKVTLRDWRAEVLFGSPAATVEAERLIDGKYIHLQPVNQLRVFTLRFEHRETIYASGLELICEPALPAL